MAAERLLCENSAKKWSRTNFEKLALLHENKNIADKFFIISAVIQQILIDETTGTAPSSHGFLMSYQPIPSSPYAIGYKFQ